MNGIVAESAWGLDLDVPDSNVTVELGGRRQASDPDQEIDDVRSFEPAQDTRREVDRSLLRFERVDERSVVALGRGIPIRVTDRVRSADGIT